MTQQPDRKKAPKASDIEHIHFIQPEVNHLKNNIPVYQITGGTQDVLMVRLMFEAGIWFQPSLLIAYLTNKLLSEGTKSYTADEIAEKFDFYGADLELEVGQDLAYISLYCLSKDVDKLLPMLEEIVKMPVYPEHEFNIFLQNAKQKMSVNLQKVKYIARRNFGELLYGNTHPYGQKVDITEYDRVSRDQLKAFHQQQYISQNCTIILAGNYNADLLPMMNNYFGGSDWQGSNRIVSLSHPLETATSRINYEERSGALQSALMIGKVLFNKKHADYPALQVLNTVLGGYFGSRLMSNIREDKGFTYGISSYVVSYHQSGMFYIISEVGSENTSSALDEIYKELRLLKDKLIPKSELELVKNYMLGSLLRSMDGPFSVGERFRAVMEFGLDMSYYDAYVNTIKTITPKQLQSLAHTYFEEDTLLELVVGKK